MSTADVRAGIAQAKENEAATLLPAFELMVLAVCVGIWLHSWTWGIAAYLAAGAAFCAKPLRPVFALVFSVMWAYVALLLGRSLGTGAGILLAGVAFLASLGAHLAAGQHVDDLNRA
jgi:hypothetical protein